MTDKIRAALEAACARAVDSMMQRDGYDVTVSHVNAGDHVVRIMTREAYDLDGEQMRRYRDKAKHAERARQDTERLLSAEADRAAEMEAQANREGGRADAAERMVVELRDRWTAVTRAYFGSSDPVVAINEFDAALSSTADVAIAARDEAVRERDRTEKTLHGFIERAKAITSTRQQQLAAEAAGEIVKAREQAAGAEAAAEGLRMQLAEAIKVQVGLEFAVIAAERARDEVGIQLAAAQERIKALETVADAVRFAKAGGLCNSQVVDATLAALDTVPGDALECACPDCVTRRAAGLDVRHGATDTNGVE